MRCGLHFLVAATLSVALAAAEPAEPAKKPRQAVLTGCLDQLESDYVLREEATLKQIAYLEAAGFSNDGFAKYVGQKVRLSGTKAETSRGITLQVRKVEVISQTCTPPPEPQ